MRRVILLIAVHNFKRLMLLLSLDVWKYFFRSQGYWNSLPAQPEDLSSLAAFKRLLQRTDMTRFMTCIYSVLFRCTFPNVFLCAVCFILYFFNLMY